MGVKGCEQRKNPRFSVGCGVQQDTLVSDTVLSDTGVSETFFDSLRLHLPSALQSPQKGGVIGILQMTAHRDAVGQPGDSDLEGF